MAMAGVSIHGVIKVTASQAYSLSRGVWTREVNVEDWTGNITRIVLFGESSDDLDIIEKVSR